MLHLRRKQSGGAMYRRGRAWMQSGLSGHVWNLEELRALLPKRISPATRIYRALIQKAGDGSAS